MVGRTGFYSLCAEVVLVAGHFRTFCKQIKAISSSRVENMFFSVLLFYLVPADMRSCRRRRRHRYLCQVSTFNIITNCDNGPCGMAMVQEDLKIMAAIFSTPPPSAKTTQTFI